MEEQKYNPAQSLLGIKWKRMFKFQLRLLYYQGRNHSTPQI